MSPPVEPREQGATGAPQAPKDIRLIIIGGAVLVAVAVVAFALFQQPSATPPPPVSMATPASSAAPSIQSARPPAAVAEASAATSPTASALPAAWESTIDQILRSNANESQMAQMLIGILPTLPEEGQVEAANHIANLLPDSSYSSVKPLLLNPNLPESVLSVFFTDLMNRDDPTKLNAFLDIAQLPNHPFHDEALSDLQIYLGDDYGTDWSLWRSKLNDYVKAAKTP